MNGKKIKFEFNFMNFYFNTTTFSIFREKNGKY